MKRENKERVVRISLYIQRYLRKDNNGNDKDACEYTG